MEEKNLNIPAYRKKWITDYVQQHGGAQIGELSIACGVSEATIRRDLQELDKEGVLERTHGGAIPTRSTSKEIAYEDKMRLMLAEKRRIAKRAAAMVAPGESLFLDSGSTCFFIAQELVHLQNLTVVTHNTTIAQAVSLHPTSTLVVTGGIKREHYNVLIGSMTESLLRDLHVDKAFLGADSVDVEKGVFNANIIELGIKRLIVECGERTILATDSSKFTTPGLVRICGIEAIDTIITDSALPGHCQRALEKKPVTLFME